MKEYRKYTQEDYQAINGINLEELLRDRGEKITKKGKDVRWEVHSSLTIQGNKWFWFKTGEGGYPLKFMQTFFDMSFKEAMETLLVYAEQRGHFVRKPEESKKPKEFELPKCSATMHRVYGYLCKTRYIGKEILDEFVQRKMLYEDVQYHNTVFVGFDEKGVPRHAHKKSTMATQGKSYRGNCEESDPRYSFYFEGSSEVLYVFESPVDLLSYITLNPSDWKNHSYVSLCGVGIQPVSQSIDRNPRIKKLMVCTDNDKAGLECFKRVRDLFEGKDIEIKLCLSKNKDFNEDLKEKNGVEPMKGIYNGQ